MLNRRLFRVQCGSVVIGAGIPSTVATNGTTAIGTIKEPNALAIMV